MNWMGPLISFVAILALIPLALWLLKRTPLGAAATGQSGMRLVACLPLAPNHRLLTVEVGQGADRQWLVLGVTPAGIRTLHTMPPQAESQPVTAGVGPSFASWLGRHGGMHGR